MMTSHNEETPYNKQCEICLTKIILPYIKRARLNIDNREDCTQSFLLKMLRVNYCIPKIKLCKCDICKPTLRCCARNHVIDFVRHLVLLQQHEYSWLDFTHINNGDAAWEPCDSDPGPEYYFFIHLFWDLVYTCLELLSPEQNMIFFNHYVNGMSIKEIANSTGRTNHAIEQTLYSIRKHIKNIFILNNITAFELRSYITYLPPLNIAYLSNTTDEDE